MKGKRIVKVG